LEPSVVRASFLRIRRSVRELSWSWEWPLDRCLCAVIAPVHAISGATPEQTGDRRAARSRDRSITTGDLEVPIVGVEGAHSNRAGSTPGKCSTAVQCCACILSLPRRCPSYRAADHRSSIRVGVEARQPEADSLFSRRCSASERLRAEYSNVDHGTAKRSGDPRTHLVYLFRVGWCLVHRNTARAMPAENAGAITIGREQKKKTEMKPEIAPHRWVAVGSSEPAAVKRSILSLGSYVRSQ